ncbi:VOC family protein [Streptomyces sp. URMC 123]|uniref:VOC family protein n=1 Tax=Streptomyces sp. URMC 123 TaxID=3423403 RepID=UPI003F1C984A
MPDVTDPYRPGTPCWVDLMAPDQQAALDFYADVLGWAGEVGPQETGGYAICTLRGRPVAGIGQAQAMGDQPAPPTVWTTYLSVDDAEAAERAVERQGGTVLMPVTDVLTFGRMLMAADPTGAVFGIWQPRDFPGAGVANEPGALIWNELNTTDYDTAAAFYATALGLHTTPMEGAEGYFALTVDGRTVGGLQKLPDHTPVGTPSHWLVYFAVADADVTASRAASSGGSVLQEPFDMAAGRMALLKDTQGAPFAIIAPAEMT